MIKKNVPAETSREPNHRLANLILADLDVRKAQAENEKASIEANKEIAVASINASKEIERERARTFLIYAKQRNFILCFIGVLVTAVLITCVCTDKADMAIKLIEYVGLTALGYVAGVNHGKYKTRHESKTDED